MSNFNIDLLIFDKSTLTFDSVRVDGPEVAVGGLYHPDGRHVPLGEGPPELPLDLGLDQGVARGPGR